MIERELKLLLNANALKTIQVHYAIMAQGYMIVADGNLLETTRRAARGFKTLDSAAKSLFKIGVAGFCGEAENELQIGKGAKAPTHKAYDFNSNKIPSLKTKQV